MPTHGPSTFSLTCTLLSAPLLLWRWARLPRAFDVPIAPMLVGRLAYLRTTTIIRLSGLRIVIPRRRRIIPTRCRRGTQLNSDAAAWSYIQTELSQNDIGISSPGSLCVRAGSALKSGLVNVILRPRLRALCDNRCAVFGGGWCQILQIDCHV